MDFAFDGKGCNRVIQKVPLFYTQIHKASSKKNGISSFVDKILQLNANMHQLSGVVPETKIQHMFRMHIAKHTKEI